MLLESALSDFNTDEPQAFPGQPGAPPYEWEGAPGKLKSSSRSESSPHSTAAGSKHGYQLDVKSSPLSAYLAGEVSVLHNRQSPGQLKSQRLTPSHGEESLSVLGLSKSPPPRDPNLSSYSRRATHGHRSAQSSDDESLTNQNMSFAGEASTGPCARKIKASKTRSLKVPSPMILPPSSVVDNNQKNRSLKSSANQNLSQDKMFTGEADVVPHVLSAQPGKSKLPEHSVARQVPLRAPPTRLSLIEERDDSASPSPRSTGAFGGPVSPLPTQRTEGVVSQGKGSNQSSKFRLGDVIQIKKPVRVPYDRNHVRADSDRGMDLEFKYNNHEKSPVSTLERLPSPPTTNSSGRSSRSSVESPRSGSIVTRDFPVQPSVQHPRPDSLSSSSNQSSPRFSTSSSAQYMSHCLVALKAVLATDPDNSARFEDSFVELDTFVDACVDETFHEGDALELENNSRENLVWADSAHVQSQPEYNTMDFYSENAVAEAHSKLGSTAASSLARSNSATSTTSVVSRAIRRSLNAPRISVDEYSEKDKRFLQDHPSSWVQQGDDSLNSSVTNSQYTSLRQSHRQVPWDEQQEDLSLARAEEVVRGAIDGLRFTYSPVSSAFVFTRSNEDEDGDPKPNARSPINTVDTDISRRFSISLDYATSACGSDSQRHSFARSSDVTELGVSRAESWSKVARAVAFQKAQQGFQDAVPSSFLRRAGYVPVYEESAGTESPEFNPRGFADTPDSRIVHKRVSKKSGMTTCLPFRSILRNLKNNGSTPGRSRLEESCIDKRQHNLTTSPIGNRTSY